MEFADIILKIFLPIIFGYLLQKTGYFGAGSGSTLRMFVIRITVPLLIFTSMYSTRRDTLNELVPITGAFLLITLILLIFSCALIPLIRDKHKRTVFMWTITFGNYAWFGWSVLYFALGQDGFERGIFFTALWWPVFLGLTFLIALFNGVIDGSRIDLKSFKVNLIMPILALILGITANLVRLPISKTVYDFMQSFASMTVPLILFTVGLSISFRKARRFIRQVLPIVLIKPILGLAAGFIAVHVINITTPLSRSAVLIESTMPVASLLLVLGDLYELDIEFIAAVIVLSTLGSLITIPLALMLFA